MSNDDSWYSAAYKKGWNDGLLRAALIVAEAMEEDPSLILQDVSQAIIKETKAD